MRKRLIVWWLVGSFLLLFAGSSVHLTPEEEAFLKAHPVITVHNEMDYPPYNFYKNGRPHGLSIDYMNLLAKRLGLRVKYIHGYDWSQFMQQIKSGKLDVMLNIMRTTERAKYLHFTEPYAATRKAIFSNDPSLNTLDDLEGKKVCVPKDFYIHHFLEDYYPEMLLVTKPSILACLRSVAQHESDATIGSYSIVSYLLKREKIKIPHLSVLSDKRMTTGLSIATAPKLKILRDILQKAMYNISDRELNALTKRWLGKSPQNPDWLYREQQQLEPYPVKRIIKMCNNPNWEPIEFAKGGDMSQMSGIAIDILKLLEPKLNVEFRNVPTHSWVESQQFLKAGRCEILPAAIATKERKQYARFTHPYLIYRLAIITRDDKPLVKDLSEIADKSVARKKGSGLISRLRHLYPTIKIIETQDYLDSLRKVESGEAYCTIATLPVASYYINRFGLKGLRIAGYTDMRYRLSIAVTKQEPELLATLDRALTQVTPREKNAIYKKWIGNKKLVEPYDYRPIYYALGAIALIVLILLYRQILLSRLNRRLNEKVKQAVQENLIQREIMREREKLAAMGEMIGVIAHQWRQPLNSLSLSIQNLKYMYQEGMVDKGFLDHFTEKNLQVINFLSQTIDDFRNFFQVGKGEKEFSVKEAIQAVISMYSLTLKKSGIVLQLSGGDFTLFGSRSEFQQVILNLISNARDALEKSPRESKKINIELQGRQIRFCDNGDGVPDAKLSRIFDAYFTTKEEGSGIGLYISRLIVEEKLKGKLTAFNEEEGLCLIMTFEEKEDA
ncbi:transporter substrate-binding domain-containing protein [Nitratifractor sp.]|uniref:transporter substrate-binding domain-containing protein n=1 Tax=Nitratifractor sp. TaxID=2268144 RepID=UPI0025E131E5|nr:transporter substrate-binding domain-containing protein [Nitratifractor sp.]